MNFVKSIFMSAIIGSITLPLPLHAFAPDQTTCAAVVIQTQQPISGLTFATPKSGPNHQSPATLLFSAYGKNGANAFTLNGDVVWQYQGRADTISAFGDFILIYQKTDTGSELRKFQLMSDGTMTFINLQNPSEIAPTTLQRSAYASFGPIRLTKDGVKTKNGLIPFSTEVKAFAATNKTNHTALKEGAVAFALADGQIEIWPAQAAKESCVTQAE